MQLRLQRPLVVNDLGVATSLGGLVQAAAGFRAGLSRPEPALGLEVMYPGDEEPAPVTVRPVPEAWAFMGAGRLVALLVEALADLGRGQKTLPQDFAIFTALPDPEARGIATQRDPLDDEPEEPTERIGALARLVVGQVAEATGLPLRGRPLVTVVGGHTAFARALAAAAAAIEERRHAAALVLAVDSLAAPEAVDLLLLDRRIKTGDNPVGFVPGEAAVALLLSAAGEERGTVRLAGLGFELEPLAQPADRPADGRAWASALRRALGERAPDRPPPVLLCDHDGESHRAGELGAALVLLTREATSLAAAPIQYPAISFGNTGAASGALGFALAVKALERGHAPGREAVIMSACDEGPRAAVHLVATQA